MKGQDRPAVVVQLAGGLGNQMFQYAAGLSLSRSVGGTLLLDRRALAISAKDPRVTTYGLALRDLSVRSSDASGRALAELGIGWTSLPSPSRFVPAPIWRPVQRLAGVWLEREVLVYRDPITEAPSTWPKVDSSVGSVYLCGYWQSEGYFRDVRAVLRQEFLPASRSLRFEDLRAEIAGQNSLIVHVRRGDYLRNRRTRRFHGVLTPTYYARAVSEIHQKTEIAATFVFTEDGDLGGLDLRGLANPRVINGREMGGSAAHHIYAMTGGSAFVVANSSFSWWAAWLSHARPSQVVAPDPWHASRRKRLSPVPESWKIVSAK